MTGDRYRFLMNNDGESLTSQELADGWHFCFEWDGLLVGPGMEERAACPSSCDLWRTPPEPRPGDPFEEQAP